MEMKERLQEILVLAQNHVGRSAPVAHSTSALDFELRRRRKNYLGSHISLWQVLEVDGSVSDEDIDILAGYLARQTLGFWQHKGEKAEGFCSAFYRLSLAALLNGTVRECADDIIQLSSALSRSTDVFRIVMEQLLPPNLLGEMFLFLESVEEDTLTPHFEDSVLYAVAAFLGSLSSPGICANDPEKEEQSNVE